MEDMQEEDIQQPEAAELEQENEALASFVTEFDQDEQQDATTEEKKEIIEKLSLTVAENLVLGGAQGLITVCNMAFACQIVISAPEMQDLSKSLAPLVVKYADDIENLPPWVQALLKYKVELIALKGVCLFGLSVTMQIKEQKRARIAEAKKQATIKAKEAAEYGNQ